MENAQYRTYCGILGTLPMLRASDPTGDPTRLSLWAKPDGLVRLPVAMTSHSDRWPKEELGEARKQGAVGG